MSEQSYKDLEPWVVAARNIAMQADRDFDDFASMHEAYGVLAEEVAEFLDAVRLRQSNRNRPLLCRKEALDIAAVALRIAAQASRVTR